MDLNAPWMSIIENPAVIRVAVVLVALGLIAWFTFGFAYVATGQRAQSPNNPTGLPFGHGDFGADLPAELVIKEVFFGEGESGPFIAYTLSNRGDRPCQISESRLLWRSGEPDTQVLHPDGANDIGPLTVKPGESLKLKHDLSAEREHFGGSARRFLNRHSFKGTIIYADSKGARRKLVFLRVSSKITDYLISTGNPEDERTDEMSPPV